MVQFRSKKTLVIGGIILAVVLLIVGTIVLLNMFNSGKSDPYKQESISSQQETTPEPTENTNTPVKDEDKATPTEDTDASTLDPDTVKTVDVVPMSLTVSYVKDIGGFEYAVMRTSSGTQYAEFSTPELVGTKCTDDEGVFASIIQDPSANDSSTLSKTVTVDGTKYGLSLADETCTKDPTLLKQYQKAFSDAFTMLKKLQ